MAFSVLPLTGQMNEAVEPVVFASLVLICVAVGMLAWWGCHQRQLSLFLADILVLAELARILEPHYIRQNDPLRRAMIGAALNAFQLRRPDQSEGGLKSLIKEEMIRSAAPFFKGLGQRKMLFVWLIVVFGVLTIGISLLVAINYLLTQPITFAGLIWISVPFLHGLGGLGLMLLAYHRSQTSLLEIKQAKADIIDHVSQRLSRRLYQPLLRAAE